MGESRTLNVRLFAHPGALSVPNPIHALRGEGPLYSLDDMAALREPQRLGKRPCAWP